MTTNHDTCVKKKSEKKKKEKRERAALLQEEDRERRSSEQPWHCTTVSRVNREKVITMPKKKKVGLQATK